MTYFGATAFAKTLAMPHFSSSLQELDLQRNHIIADGVVAIANAMQHCLALVTLQARLLLRQLAVSGSWVVRIAS